MKTTCRHKDTHIINGVRVTHFRLVVSESKLLGVNRISDFFVVDEELDQIIEVLKEARESEAENER